MLDDFQPRRQPKKVLQPVSQPGQHEAIKTELARTAVPAQLDDIEIGNAGEEPRQAAPAPESVSKKTLPTWLNPKLWSKKQRIIAAVAMLVVFGGTFGVVKALTGHDTPAPVVANTAPAAPKVKPTPILSPLTGLEVSSEQSKWPVTGVMIENSQDARPQSGLDKAGVVYEAVAEGGITRFLALFQEGDPDYVGPVRSVRPYYLDWLTGNDAAISHVGGSPEALTKIKTNGIKDLDQFYAGSSYTRISGRAQPHNVYTSLARLRELENSRGYSTSSFAAWPRKADSKAASPSATSIDFGISSALYNVHYDYDVTDNSYHRSEGGKPHLVVDSAGNSTQLKPKVVIGIVMSKALQADKKHYDYNTIGSGAAYIYQDGTLVLGTWTKPDAKTNISFADQSGKSINLNAGQTWISVVDAANRITTK
ncbi:MAG: hypothetical protein JWM37_82 [Candidatus Saccharibacteria bacterium]|nr:hypothetical protein [Candidatus Saccharibacteria bacterium]